MKRVLLSFVAAALVGSALAQGTAPFTIVRPADGSKVREDVHILFPMGSVDTEKGGYVGIYVNGKFIEAAVPEKGAKFLNYTLDTKALNIPDGQATIEAVLYMDFDEKPRIVDRSSVQVTVANQANIPVPADGFRLRYHWQPGHDWIYNWDSTLTVSTISEAQAKMGGHAAQIPVESYNGLMVYSMDNTYSDGDALLRMQLEPPKGKNSLILALASDPQPKRVFEFELYPVYMRVQNTGNEIFGLIPKFWDFSGGENGYSPVDVLAPNLLPTLPSKSVKPNDSWQARFQMPNHLSGSIDEANLSNHLIEKLPARGEFVGLEWEMGHPCAKIHHTFSVGSGGEGEGANAIKSNAVSMDETFWFALDRGTVVKLIRSQVIDRKLTDETVNNIRNPNAGMNIGPGGPGSGPGQAGQGRSGMPPIRGPKGKGGGLGLGAGYIKGQFPGGAGQAGAFGGGQGAAGQGLGGNGFGFQRSGGAPADNGGQLYRITVTEVFTLTN